MAQSLGSVAVGLTVKLNVGGSPREFIVVQQGKPSDLYYDTCDGTWLLMKDIIKKQAFTTKIGSTATGNDYSESEAASYLNNTFYNLLDPNIKSAIHPARIPYRPGNGTSSTIAAGVNGLGCKIFLLSASELALPIYDFPIDGSILTYFFNGGTHVAYYNGVSNEWWLRTPSLRNEAIAEAIVNRGGTSIQHCKVGYDIVGIRPALILPKSCFVLDDGTVTTNQPPIAPPSITVSEPVKGGKAVTISWGVSTDADGNLSGYRLERSVNNAAFQQIHDGNTLTFSDNITYGWQTVAYRVRAYDSAGAVSGYATSRAYTVINNSAPTAPPWLNIPAEIKGGKPFEISWGASTDVDGNLAGYQLERSLNGGAFGQIYTGANQKYTDTVAKGTNTAAYRVRAYDTENAQSGYAVSDTRKIINNTPPSISGEDSQLGTKNEPFSISYSVNDPDGDAITVTEKLDNQVLRTFTAEAGKEYQVTLDADRFLQILNGSHTLTVTATDAPGESAVRTWTWTKNITHISIVKKVPKEPADEGCPYKCLLNLNSIIPTGALVTVEVCNNGFDQQPTWEECTAGARAGDVIFFSNRRKTAEKWGVNFRVTISRSGAPGDCYVTGVSGNFEEERNA